MYLTKIDTFLKFELGDMKFITIIFFLAFANVFSQDITDNLLLEYSFNGNTNDSSINENHGINFGATFVEDRFGNPNSAIYFDGIDDYVEFPNLVELKPDLPISFSFWINHHSLNPEDRDVFNTSFAEDISSGVFFNSQIATGNYAINFGDGSNSYISSTRRTYVTDKPLIIDQWQHIIIVINSATDMIIYVDCVENGGVYSGSGGDLEYSNSAGSLGRHDRDLTALANYFKGNLDDFRYWDRELTSDEINSLCSGLSVDEIEEKTNTIIYPNPSNGVFNIHSTISNIELITIFNGVGQQVYKSEFTPEVDLSSWSKGIYYLNLIKDDKVIRKKIIIF